MRLTLQVGNGAFRPLTNDSLCDTVWHSVLIQHHLVCWQIYNVAIVHWKTIMWFQKEGTELMVDKSHISLLGSLPLWDQLVMRGNQVFLEEIIYFVLISWQCHLWKVACCETVVNKSRSWWRREDKRFAGQTCSIHSNQKECNSTNFQSGDQQKYKVKNNDYLHLRLSSGGQWVQQH